jgi:hypothetical protein
MLSVKPKRPTAVTTEGYKVGRRTPRLAPKTGARTWGTRRRRSSVVTPRVSRRLKAHSFAPNANEWGTRGCLGHPSVFARVGNRLEQPCNPVICTLRERGEHWAEFQPFAKDAKGGATSVKGRASPHRHDWNVRRPEPSRIKHLSLGSLVNKTCAVGSGP